MRNLIQNLTLLLIMIIPIGAIAGARTEKARLEYIAKHKPYALMVELRYGIPASICMAQALLETDAGRSKLNLLGNNHFGIKAGTAWTGPTMNKIDDEVDIEGNPVPSSFRVYENTAASFQNYGRMLSTSKRYRNLGRLDKADYRAWAHGLKNRGYATNPQYAYLLIHLIKRYKLDDISLMQVRTFPAHPLLQDESASSDNACFQWDMPIQYRQPIYAMMGHSELFRIIMLFFLLNLLYKPLKGLWKQYRISGL